MNKVIQTILKRTSNREYSEKKVSLSKLNMILEAGKMAPSGMNRQIANILCVRTKKYVEKLRQASIDFRGRDCFYGANTMIIVYGPRNDNFLFQDCSCVLENMFIAATALNIQSCWINQVEDIFATPNGKKLKKSLGIPEDAQVIGTCIVGYSKDGSFPQQKARKDEFVRIK